MNVCRSCRRDFGSVAAFDAHRAGRHGYLLREGLRLEPPREDGRRCLDDAEMTAAGMTKDAAGRWRLPARVEPEWRTAAVEATQEPKRSRPRTRTSANPGTAKLQRAGVEALIDSEAARRGGGCEDCGRDYEPGPDFHWHHRAPASKAFGIARSRTRSTKSVLGELAKCDLLCAPCHRRRHKAGSGGLEAAA